MSVSSSGARRSLTQGADSEETILLSLPELDVHRGDRIVITGPSGSGKSLLLSCLTGRWAPGLTFHGERYCAAERIGFVPQRGLEALHPLMPIRRQLRAVTGASPARVEEVLAAVGLDDAGLQRRRPTEISGGQAQRVAMALGVLAGAPLMLADEPTSALDNDSRDQLLELLARIVTPEQALVVATHDLVVAESIATRHLKVTSGQVEEVAVVRSGEGTGSENLAAKSPAANDSAAKSPAANPSPSTAGVVA
ncbi:MAG: ATP-binding cassette domain-containing protein [Ancrocorticia sp.]